MAHKVVIIDANGENVRPELVELSESANDELVWLGAHKNKAKLGIQFEGAQKRPSPEESPFEQAEYTVGPGEWVSSGRLSPTVKFGIYKYTIRDESGTLVLDPRVKVKH